MRRTTIAELRGLRSELCFPVRFWTLAFEIAVFLLHNMRSFYTC